VNLKEEFINSPDLEFELYGKKYKIEKTLKTYNGKYHGSSKSEKER